MDAIALEPDPRARQRAHDRRIASGALRVGLLVLLAKICVAAREVSIAAVFGTSQVVDSYNLAFSVVTWLPVMLAAASGAAVVPALVRLRPEPGRYAAFASELNGLSLAGALALAVLTALVGPTCAQALAGEAQSTGALAAAMTFGMAPFAGLMLVSGFYALRLQAEERFLYSALEAMPALCVAFAAIAAGSAWGGDALVAGTLIGGFAQAAALIALLKGLSAGFGGHRLRLRSPEWKPVAAGLLAMGVGQALIYSTVPLDQFVAGRSGEGGVAILGYANRLIGIATSMGTVVLARALLPIVSSAIAAGDDALARAQTVRWMWIVLLAAIPLAAIGFVLTPWAVALILQRGAFSVQDTAAVSWIVQIGLSQLPFYLGGLVVVQWLAATGRYRRIAAIAGVAVAMKALVMLLLPGHWGVEAVMISTVVMYAVSFVMQSFSLLEGRASGLISRSARP